LTLTKTLFLTNAHNNAIQVARPSAILHGNKDLILTLVIVNQKKMKRKTLILLIKMLTKVIIATMSNLFGVK